MASQLQAALSSWQVIDQAIGFVLARTGATSEEVFTRLPTISQTEHIKLAVVVQRVEDGAVRRARARHTASAHERS